MNLTSQFHNRHWFLSWGDWMLIPAINMLVIGIAQQKKAGSIKLTLWISEAAAWWCDSISAAITGCDSIAIDDFEWNRRMQFLLYTDYNEQQLMHRGAVPYAKQEEGGRRSRVRVRSCPWNREPSKAKRVCTKCSSIDTRLKIRFLRRCSIYVI